MVLWLLLATLAATTTAATTTPITTVPAVTTTTITTTTTTITTTAPAATTTFTATVLAAPAPPGAPNCDAIIGDFPLVDTNPNPCKKSSILLGNAVARVTLIFSQAKDTTLNPFLGQGFTEIYGAIIMDSNDDVKKIDFGAIKMWDGKNMPNNAIFISIRNNPNLQSITGSQMNDLSIQASNHKDGDGLQILIYNNPALDTTSIKAIEAAIVTGKHKNDFDISIQSGPNECRFQHPFNETDYTAPVSDAFLAKCKSIKGDLILKGGRLGGDLTLDTACLRLINVDMTGFHLNTTASGKGKDLCGNGLKSEISKNPNLCGDELEKIKNYFTNSSVTIQLDASCTIDCTTREQVDHKYYYCRKIEVASDITKWFTDKNLTLKVGKLESATKQLTIGGKMTSIALGALTSAVELKIADNPDLTQMDLPKLTKVDRLDISRNAQLTTLSLPLLATIDELIIEGNDLLTIDKIKSLPLPSLNSSKVECRTSKAIILSSFEELRLCTSIHGDLVLKNMKNTSIPDLIRATQIEGCIHMEDTELWDLDWLQKTTTTCATQHVFKNNPNLCPLSYFKTGYAKVEPPEAIGCDKVCKTITEGDCTRLDGDLVMDEATAKLVGKLVIIRGQLLINGTSLTELEFPELAVIYSKNGTQLVVTNNPKLKSLKMAKFPRFEPAGSTGQQQVYIEKNPLLTKLGDFLSATMAAGCMRKAKSVCYYDPGIYTTQTGTGMSWRKILLIAGSSLLALGVIVGVAACLLIWRHNRRHYWEHRLIYKFYTDYAFGTIGYELKPLITTYEPRLGKKVNLECILHQIVVNGLMRHNVINWRQKFLENPEHRMEYYAKRYPYNKMTFYGNTYYLQMKGTIPRLYKKLAKLIAAKKKELNGAEVKPVLSRIRGIIKKNVHMKYPEKLNRMHLIFIGGQDLAFVQMPISDTVPKSSKKEYIMVNLDEWEKEQKKNGETTEEETSAKDKSGSEKKAASGKEKKSKEDKKENKEKTSKSGEKVETKEKDNKKKDSKQEKKSKEDEKEKKKKREKSGKNEEEGQSHEKTKEELEEEEEYNRTEEAFRQLVKDYGKFEKDGGEVQSTTHTEGDYSIRFTNDCSTNFNEENRIQVEKSGYHPTRPPLRFMGDYGYGLQCQTIKVKLTNSKKKEVIEMSNIELTSEKLKLPMLSLFFPGKTPWWHLLWLAMRYKIPIITDSNEYFILINMILCTWKILLNPKWRKNYDNDNLIEFGEGLYRRFKALYNPKSDPVTPWVVWVYAATQLYSEVLHTGSLRRRMKNMSIGEKIEFRYDMQDYPEDCINTEYTRWSLAVKEGAPTIEWHKMERIPLKGIFTEKCKIKLDEEPRPDMKYAEEYLSMAPDEDVLQLLRENPNKGRVKLEAISPRPRMSQIRLAAREQDRKDELWREEHIYPKWDGEQWLSQEEFKQREIDKKAAEEREELEAKKADEYYKNFFGWNKKSPAAAPAAAAPTTKSTEKTAATTTTTPSATNSKSKKNETTTPK